MVKVINIANELKNQDKLEWLQENLKKIAFFKLKSKPNSKKTAISNQMEFAHSRKMAYAMYVNYLAVLISPSKSIVPTQVKKTKVGEILIYGRSVSNRDQNLVIHLSQIIEKEVYMFE